MAKKITIAGCGYVGMSLAVLLSRNNDVTVYDIDSERVDKINNRVSTVYDKDIDNALTNPDLRLSATTIKKIAYKNADIVIISTPTDYDASNNSFDTSSVDLSVKDILKYNKEAVILIKSTIPVGHTLLLQKKYKTQKIIFSPEFLREGQALKDNLYPSRIIIGSKEHYGSDLADLFTQAAKKKNIHILFTSSTEAEAIKLFANTYLAMRISFFNELDSYSMNHNLSTKNLIDGISLDNRIGKGYNNPSFGYGGYCLPKDTKQLLANYKNVPQRLIEAIITSNSTRKDFIANEILKLEPNTVGFFRLIMKQGSDNFRSSAIQGIIRRIQCKKNIKIVIYEPQLHLSEYDGLEVIKDLDEFKKVSDIIVANRFSELLNDVTDKCFTRDIFGKD